MHIQSGSLSIPTNSVLVKKKQKKGALNTNAHTYKYMHTAVSNIQAEHTHTAPHILPTSSYAILLHHSIFIYLFLTLFLEYWTFHPPSIPQKPSPFSPIPPIFFGGGVPFKFSISQLKFRLPPTIHTCSWHHVSPSLYPIYSTLFLYFSLPTSSFLTFLILYICRLEELVCRHKGIQCS